MMKKCDHTIGYLHLQYEPGTFVCESDLPRVKDTTDLFYIKEDIEFFNYCPECGQKLKYGE
jgi:hypothetical protein